MISNRSGWTDLPSCPRARGKTPARRRGPCQHQGAKPPDGATIASADAAIGLIAATAALSPDYLMLRGV